MLNICNDGLCDSPEQAKEIAEKMIGAHLITKQTGAGGRVCNSVGFLLVFVNDYSNVVNSFRSCWQSKDNPHMNTMSRC